MQDIQTTIDGLVLVRPDPDRDAPFALSWFEAPYGKETLLLMGNPAHQLSTPSLDKEMNRIQDFLKLQKENKQLTWMLRYNHKTIGAVWLDLQDREYLKSPAFHIMIGDKEHRGQGFGKAAMQEIINYTREVLKSKTLYSRHLTNNSSIAHLNATFGFMNDGAPYKDREGLEFQNVILKL